MWNWLKFEIYKHYQCSKTLQTIVLDEPSTALENMQTSEPQELVQWCQPCSQQPGIVTDKWNFWRNCLHVSKVTITGM